MYPGNGATVSIILDFMATLYHNNDQVSTQLNPRPLAVSPEELRAIRRVSGLCPNSSWPGRVLTTVTGVGHAVVKAALPVVEE